MLSASLYITVRSTRNRLLIRLRRLREPRYLLGAVLGAAYIYFSVFVPRRAAARRGPNRGFPGVPSFERIGPALGGVGLLFLAGATWIFPSSSHLFDFTEAETSFLVPAPVSRRQLLMYRLVRSQFGLLIAAMIPAFFVSTPGSRTVSETVLRGLALWITFVTIRVYFAGVSMARARLGSADPGARRVARALLVTTIAAVAAVALPFLRTIQAPPGPTFADTLARIAEATTTGLPGLVLLPFRTIVRPLFVQGAGPYLTAMAGSFGVLLVMLVAVVQMDRVFYEAVDDHVIQKAAPTRRRRAAAPRVRWVGWQLPAAGRCETLFLWKNGMQTLRSLNIGSVLGPGIAVLLGSISATVAITARQNRGLASTACVAALLFATGATILGPMNVMNDLRGDLRHLELIKTWPVKGGALIRGEMLWPALMLTVLAWLALTCAAILSAAAFPQAPFVWRVALCATAIVLVPAFIFAQYTIHHAVAVMLPAWVPPDNEMRGFESMAQRLILLAAVMLSLFVMVGPGAIAGGIVGFVFYRLIESPLVFVPAAAVCLAIVAVEVLLATEALGPAYDRIDLSGVERGETM